MKNIEIIDGDITQLKVDAIVNAANDHLWMGTGVAGAIRLAGGESIEREAVALGPIPVGKAVVTSAGRLPCRWVIHGAVMGQDLATNLTKLHATVHSCLELAAVLGARSIAFPLLGTGVGGMSYYRSAAGIADVIEEDEPDLDRIVLCVFGKRARADAEAGIRGLLLAPKERVLG